ncbi:MAG: hypothetical protein LBF61_02660 [Azoarcus sp.]|jgi:hypothetical protein|nr:hypothetical protein [Azoarcus sp.]
MISTPRLTAIIAAIAFALGLWAGIALQCASRERLASEWAEERERLAREHTQALADVLSRERRLAQRLADESQRYEQERKNAQETSDRVARSLRSNALQLRQRWAGCEAARLPATPPAARQPDATAADRADSAGRIVRAADECDAQVKGLQALLKAERENRTEKTP